MQTPNISYLKSKVLTLLGGCGSAVLGKLSPSQQGTTIMGFLTPSCPGS